MKNGKRNKNRKLHLSGYSSFAIGLCIGFLAVWIFDNLTLGLCLSICIGLLFKKISQKR